MKRRTLLQSAVAVSTTSLLGLSGCTAPTADEKPNGGGNGVSTPTGTESGGTVQMVTDGSNYYFDPIGLFVEPGARVTWEIQNGVHSSTAYEDGNGPATVTRIPEDAEAWNSGTLTEAGATFTHTFDVEGTYDYFCIPHKSLGLVGRIVARAPGGPAEGSMPPDGTVPESQTIIDQGTVPYSEFR